MSEYLKKQVEDAQTRLREALMGEYGVSYLNEEVPNINASLTLDDQDQVILIVWEDGVPHDHPYNPAQAKIDFALKKSKELLQDSEIALDPRVISFETFNPPKENLEL